MRSVNERGQKEVDRLIARGKLRISKFLNLSIDTLIEDDLRPRLYNWLDGSDLNFDERCTIRGYFEWQTKELRRYRE